MEYTLRIIMYILIYPVALFIQRKKIRKLSRRVGFLEGARDSQMQGQTDLERRIATLEAANTALDRKSRRKRRRGRAFHLGGKTQRAVRDGFHRSRPALFRSGPRHGQRDDKVVEAAQANNFANFSAYFGRILEDLFIDRMEGNEEIFSRVMRHFPSPEAPMT